MNPLYKEKVHAFFKEMKTPNDVEKEIGRTVTTDRSQLRITGGYRNDLSRSYQKSKAAAR